MKNLSKIIIASVLILGSLLLKQGIHQAQAQVNPTTDCYIFSLNHGLNEGMTPQEGFEVMNALRLSGSWANGNPYGTIYNQSYVNAVKSFQANNGIPDTGYFGPLTRATLNASSWCANPNSPLTVISPNGENIVEAGKPYTVKYVSNLPNNSVWVYLHKYDANGNSISSYLVGKNNPGKNEISMTITDNILNGLGGAGSTFKIRLWSDANQNPEDLSDGYFTILPAGATPKISIVTRIDGAVVALGQNGSCTSSLVRPVGTNNTGSCTRTLTPDATGSYSVQWYNGFPTGTDVNVNPTITPAQIFTGNNSLTFYLDFKSSLVVRPRITATQDLASPLERVILISEIAPTYNVAMLVVDLKSSGAQSTLTKLKLDIHTTGVTPGVLIADAKIRVNGVTYSGTVTQTGSNSATADFDNLVVSLPADMYQPIQVLLDIQKDADGSRENTSASVKLIADATHIVARDSSFQPVDVNPSTIQGSIAHFSSSGVLISNKLGTLGSPIYSGNTLTAFPVTFDFTVTAGDNTVFISANPTVSVLTKTTNLNPPSLARLTLVSANPGSVSGDYTGNYFIVPAGAQRSFKYSGIISNDSAGGMKRYEIATVYYGTDPSALQGRSIVRGLDELKVSPVFSNLYKSVTPVKPIETVQPLQQLNSFDTRLTSAIWDAIREYYQTLGQ